MVPDPTFLALAREAGQPAPELVEALLVQQQEFARQGEQVTLFELAKSSGALGAAEAARFEELARAARTDNASKPDVRPRVGTRRSPRPARSSTSSSGRHRALAARAGGPPRAKASPVLLLAGVAVGGFVIALGAALAVLGSRKPAPAAPSTAQAQPAPRNDAGASSTDRFMALAEAEAVKARELVESGRGADALTRIDRLLERWKPDPAAKDGLDELARLREWVVDSDRSREQPEKEPAPAPTPQPGAAKPTATEAPPPRPRRPAPDDEEDAPDDVPDPRPRPVGPSGPARGPAPAPTGGGRGAKPVSPQPGAGGQPAAAGAPAGGGGRGVTLDPAYEARRREVPATDADGFVRLAKWAEKEDLFEEEKDALVLALRVDPEHKRARARLDEVLAAETRHRDYATPWRREASVLFVETNTSQALLYSYCDSVAAFYKRFSKVFRVTQDPVQKWGRKIGVRIFASREDFDRYRKAASGAGESAVGFYSLRDKELVLYHDADDVEETLNTLFHEGTHLFTHLALGDRFHDVPMWVSEGIAEYFGTARFDRKKKDMEFGALSYPRLLHARECFERQSISLRDDVVGHPDPRSFEAAHYALAWSLVHMLIEKTRPGSDKPIYRDRFVAYFDAVAGGADSVKAFEAHVGPLRAIEAEWKAYVTELPLPPIQAGIARLDAGELEAAIALFEEHRRTEPQDAKGAFWLGEALAEAGRFDEAADAYRAAVALDPQHVQSFVSLGWALLRLDRAAEAVEAAQQAVAIRPSGEHQTLLAMAAVQAGNKPVAVAATREAIALLGPLPLLRRLKALADAL